MYSGGANTKAIFPNIRITSPKAEEASVLRVIPSPKAEEASVLRGTSPKAEEASVLRVIFERFRANHLFQ